MEVPRRRSVHPGPESGHLSAHATGAERAGLSARRRTVHRGARPGTRAARPTPRDSPASDAAPTARGPSPPRRTCAPGRAGLVAALRASRRPHTPRTRRPRKSPPRSSPDQPPLNHLDGENHSGLLLAREGRWQLKEARPAGATPGTHLCSGGKPVAKKNVQGGYGTYIRSSPTLGEEGGASTRHHFPSLPRANSIRHRFGRHPLPLLLGDRGRCALSPLKSAHLLAHAPLDPDDGESPPWAGSSLAPAFSSSRGWRVQGPGSQGSEGPEGPPSQPENPQGFQLGGRDPDECALGLAFWLVPVRARCFYRSPSHTFTPYALLNGEKNNPAFHIKQQNGPRVFQEQIKTAGLSLLCPRKKGKLKKCASKAIPDCKQVFPNVWDCSWSLFPERKD
ncbi:translation initiation factor IF-2-like isoform X1 [Canis lupus familiaris]|uniref:translation initiation factor IF-2-like isoform X1 n=1 Tax=Canis lupus familiaris TaxID=9615 RepID=UPI0018F7AEFD|nr:translation initiation factor IF-2-like isoform X1 [Canis lupus familiaris]XP_038541917.1 translation initiation factor IF-2-like isoform X1 [Canis lupus familiaris]